MNRLLMNSRKTECGANQFLTGWVVRAAPFALLRIVFFVGALALTRMAASATPIIVTSAQINAYFGTAKLLSASNATLFNQSYLFLSNSISPDLAASITMDMLASAFPIFQNNVTAAATLDSTLFVQEISNANCVTAGALCDPTHLLTVFPADASLTAAVHNLPLPPGTAAHPLIDTGNIFKGNLQYVASAFATDNMTIIEASINISLFEHDFTAAAIPIPEPATWLLMAVPFAAMGWSRKRLDAKPYRTRADRSGKSAAQPGGSSSRASEIRHKAPHRTRPLSD